MSFTIWKKLDQQSIAIKHLWIVLGVMAGIMVILILCLATGPSRLRVYIPPDLSRGVLIKQGSIPKATVYAFAFQIFSAINTWPVSGEKNYGKNLMAYRNYLSPGFYAQLNQDLKDKESLGALSRKRMMSGYSGLPYQPKDVTRLGNGAWRVNLHVQIMESLDGSVIKNVVMDYPLIISQVHASIQVNPWGLVITGYKRAPYRLKTVV